MRGVLILHTVSRLLRHYFKKGSRRKAYKKRVMLAAMAREVRRVEKPATSNISDPPEPVKQLNAGLQNQKFSSFELRQ